MWRHPSRRRSRVCPLATRPKRRTGTGGWPTVKAIVGDKLAPRRADWYLARGGYESQQTDQPVESDRRDNLWQAVPGDHGAHGTFDDRARSCSVQLRAPTHRCWLALRATALLGAAWLGTALASALPFGTTRRGT